MLHIYYGDGKGKTTAAMGLALRMLGCNKKVQVIQFLKDGKSSEVVLLKKLGVDVQAKVLPQMFVDFNDPKMIKDVAFLQQELFDCIDPTVDCIILDELLDAITVSMLNEDTVYQFLMKYKDTSEIVLTGRSPSQKIKVISDYMTQMKAVKHPYTKGVVARKGVEF